MVEPLDSPAYEPLYLIQRSDMSRSWTWEQNGVAVSLVGFTAQAEVRRWAGGDLILNLTPYLSIEDDAIKLEIPGDDILALGVQRGYWDLFLVSGSQKFMFMWGHVEIRAAVTVVT